MTVAAGSPARAASTTDPTAAFERSFATSLYVFDACGDPLEGRIFRKALGEKVGQCAFPPAAMERYRQRTAMLQRKAKDLMDKMIEDHGGLPMRLDGMTSTCHGQQSSDAYQQLRTRLEAYSQGQGTAESIIPSACDADDVTP